jgi:hypothetical protein
VISTPFDVFDHLYYPATGDAMAALVAINTAACVVIVFGAVAMMAVISDGPWRYPSGSRAVMRTLLAIVAVSAFSTAAGHASGEYRLVTASEVALHVSIAATLITAAAIRVWQYRLSEHRP